MQKTWLKTALLVAALSLLVAGCGPNLAEQPKIMDPYAASVNFGTGARVLNENAVSFSDISAEDELAYFGTIDGEFVDEFPMEIDAEVLEYGQLMYESFCTPCHGQAGYGNGVISLEGYWAPGNFHSERIRNAPAGAIYNTVTNGSQSGLMYGMDGMITREGRWAVVAYVRALQLSQRAPIDSLSDELQAQAANLN